MLRDCYLPEFQYRKDGPTAGQVWTMFRQEFRFLPDCCSEPERLAKLIQHLLYEQRSLKIRPPECPKHELRMILLGRLGWTYQMLKKRNRMATINQVGNGGGLFVANGIFRCPHPACYFVAPTESSVTIRQAEVD